MIVGTAGHIDHGKTALVRRLTGIDTDRLPEEKRRGMTIDLGFAHLDLDGIGRVGVVDVPGHERFIRTMVAGATGMDLVLLVVAADDGVMPQTLEHLDIVSLLKIPRAIVALNKVDLVDAARLGAVESDVRAMLADTDFSDAPVIAVSAETGEGTENLRAALTRALHDIRVRRTDGYFRLPVDRAFVMPGFGPVVTGTVASGGVRREARVRLLPGGKEARVRGIHTHNRAVEAASAGNRCALNLSGIGIEALARGMVVADPRLARMAHTLDVWLTVAPHAPVLPKNHRRVRVHAGTAEGFARLVWLADRPPGPGEGALAQLRLDDPGPFLYGDRLVVRSEEALHTLAGGVVLDPFAARRAVRSALRLARLRRLRGLDAGAALDVWLEARGAAGWFVEDLGEQLAEAPERLLLRLATRSDVVRAELGGTVWVAPGREVDALTRKLPRALADHMIGRPGAPAMPTAALHQAACPHLDARVFRWLLARLAAEGKIEQTADGVRPPGHRQQFGPRERALAEKIEATLACRGGTPPKLAALAAAVGLPAKQLAPFLAELQRAGRLSRIAEDVYIRPADLDAWRAQAARLLAEKGSLSLGEFRDAIGVGREFALQVLEHFDRHGLTRRQGNVRVAARERPRA
jgi:selenocysteine-specific elongation factor